MDDSQTKLQSAPNAVASLVLGICSLVLSCFFVGFLCGIVGWVMAAQGLKAYRLSPGSYDGYSLLNAGRILSIIGTVLGLLYIFAYIMLLAFVGMAGLAEIMATV